MNIKNCFKKFTIAILILFITAEISSAQTEKSIVPRQEKLLNGLKLLTFSDSNADKVELKLRIHSGSVFDRRDKEGTMALLGDILFPNEQSKEFFREDLGGGLEVKTTYDYIEITAMSDTAQYLPMLETIAGAVSKLQIDKETTAKVISARLKTIKESEKNPYYVADLAAAHRLYGEFPYGRSQMGTGESLAKIDFADLIFARDKFLTPDNSTLTVSGAVKANLVSRAVRRYFGAWEKSGSKIPATFAQPEAPNIEVFKISLKNIEKEFARNASQGVARNDKDYFANAILAKVWQTRIGKFPDGFVKYDPHLIKGIVTWGISFTDDGGGKLKAENQQTGQVIKPEEFAKAKTELLNELNQKSAAELWLDVDTYKLVSVKDDMQKANSITYEDARRFFERMQKEPFVTLFVEKSEDNK